MSLFTKLPGVIIYIQAHALDFVFTRGGQVLHLDLPTSLLDNLEVNDQIGLEKHLDSFIKNNKIKKQEALLLLAEALVFEKHIPHSEQVTGDLIQKFVDNVPLKPTEIIHKSIPLENETLVLVTNHDIFQVIINVLIKNEWKVKTVIPIHVTPELLGSNQLNLGTLKNALRNDKLVNTYNLYQPTAESLEQSTGINKLWIVGAGLLILGVIGFVLLETTGLLKLPAVTIPGIITAQPSPTITPVPPTPTKTPTPIVGIDKSAHKISILNGSGIAGEARLVQEQLEELEFIVAETGNATRSDYTKTEIAVKKEVSESFLKELKEIIAESYTLEEKVGLLEDDAETDLVITIGQDKK